AGREDPLLPDEERAAVDGMARRDSRMVEERRNYLAALAAAGERLLFVARADMRGQRARLASRWLLDTASALAGTRVAATTLEACTGTWFRSVPSFEAALLGDAQAASLQEHDLRDLARWRAGGRAVTSHALVGAEAALAAGFEAQRARRGRAFGRWNGYVPDAAVRSPYGGLPLSATALQGYASCPFSYFLGRLLRVAPYEVPADELTITPLTKGSLIHEVLEGFIREVAPRETPEQEWTPEERTRLQAIGAAACDAYETRGMTGRPLLWEAARGRLLADLDRFLDADQALRARFGVVPVAPEMAFGMEGEPEAHIEVGEGRVLNLRGKIDRLDRSPDGRKLVVLDYKTGSARWGYPELEGDPVHRGKLLQLPLYAAAALQREDSRTVTEVYSYYWFITEGGEFKTIGYPVGDPQRQRFEQVLSVIGDSIQDGIFPARPGTWRFGDFENCKFCDYKDLCPGDRDSAWERIRDDERLGPYVELAEPEDGA
ncbi:MAG: hypothetical protein GEU80_03580, partial [Dehalococcoidia bacterium]|nr:hypothetical protein [Dehalococcoidia bacterium]